MTSSPISPPTGTTTAPTCVVALSSHDSTPSTYDAFARAFGERHRTVLVGEELRIHGRT
jgi:hypothetical protein